MHKQFTIQEGSISFLIDPHVVSLDDGEFHLLAQANPDGGNILVVKDSDNKIKVFFVGVGIGRTNIEYDPQNLDKNRKHEITASWKIGDNLSLYVDGIEAAKEALREDAFINDSIEFKNILLKYGSKLADKIDEFERSSESHTAYYAYLKDFLVNDGVLADDILQAVANDATLLAMIGARVLIEDAINVHYLESKPENERMPLAEKWFAISNNDKAQKNAIDEKSVAQRAKLAGKDVGELYANEYALFSNYIHSSAQRAILNVPEHRQLGGRKSVIVGLQSYANIVTCIARLIGKDKPEFMSDFAAAYFAKYRETVSEASLPLEG